MRRQQQQCARPARDTEVEICDMPDSAPCPVPVRRRRVQGATAGGGGVVGVGGGAVFHCFDCSCGEVSCRLLHASVEEQRRRGQDATAASDSEKVGSQASVCVTHVFSPLHLCDFPCLVAGRRATAGGFNQFSYFCFLFLIIYL